VTQYKIRIFGEGWMIHLVSKTKPEFARDSMARIRGISWTPIDDLTQTDILEYINWDKVSAVSIREEVK